MARLNAVQIAVDKQLQHHFRVITRTPRVGRLGLETEARQIKLINETIDDPRSTFFGYVIIKSLGE